MRVSIAMGRRRHLRMQIDGAEERLGRDDPEQGRPVLDEALGVAERVGGESRRISDAVH